MINVRIVSVFALWGLLYGYFLDDPIGGLAMPLGAGFFVLVWENQSFAWPFLRRPLWHPLRYVPVLIFLVAGPVFWLFGFAFLHDLTGYPMGEAFRIFPATIFACSGIQWAIAPFIVPATHPEDGYAGGCSHPRPMSQPSRQRRQGD